MDGSQKEGGNFLNLLQKEGGSLRKGGVSAVEETMVTVHPQLVFNNNPVHEKHLGMFLDFKLNFSKIF